MQAQTFNDGTEKANTPRYDTIVIRGAQGETIPKEVDGGEVVVWSRGHNIAAMNALEEFVEDLAAGNCPYPAELTKRAGYAMALMKQRLELGWDVDEPEKPWTLVIQEAKDTALQVFGGCHDDAMQAIEYLSALLFESAPAEHGGAVPS